MDYSLSPTLILSAAGATVVATTITALVEIIKNALPSVIQKSWEPTLATVFSFGAVAYAYFATLHGVDAVSAIAAIVAAISIAKLSTAVYDTAVKHDLLKSGDETLVAKGLLLPDINLAGFEDVIPLPPGAVKPVVDKAKPTR